MSEHFQNIVPLVSAHRNLHHPNCLANDLKSCVVTGAATTSRELYVWYCYESNGQTHVQLQVPRHISSHINTHQHIEEKNKIDVAAIWNGVTVTVPSHETQLTVGKSYVAVAYDMDYDTTYSMIETGRFRLVVNRTVDLTPSETFRARFYAYAP